MCKALYSLVTPDILGLFDCSGRRLTLVAVSQWRLGGSGAQREQGRHQTDGGVLHEQRREQSQQPAAAHTRERVSKLLL